MRGCWVAPRRLLQLLHRPGCHSVNCGLQLQEAAIGKARTRVGLQTQRRRAAGDAGLLCWPVAGGMSTEAAVCCCVTCLPKASGDGSCRWCASRSVPAKEAMRMCWALLWVVATGHRLGGCKACLLCSTECFEVQSFSSVVAVHCLAGL